MRESTKADVLLRLKSLEGHIRGIQKMIEEDRYCVEILKQTAAVKGAIDRLDATILANHLDTCVTTARSCSRCGSSVSPCSRAGRMVVKNGQSPPAR